MAIAQIPVAVNGTPTISFDIPLSATEWATLPNGIGTDVGTYLTPGDLEAAAQTIDQSQVTAALPTTGIYGTSQAARHNTNATRLVTQPTGIGAVVLKATLRNTSGLSLFSIKITYDYDVVTTPAFETAPGHRAFWSQTGQTNSWRALTNLSGLNAPATLNEAIHFSPAWAPNTDIYLLWLDDNAITGPEGAYTIDNFTVSDVIHGDFISRLNISLNSSNGMVQVSWNGAGILQQATTLLNSGTFWADVFTTSNSYSFTPSPSSAQFFRLR